jgi:hypothetical protein
MVISLRGAVRSVVVIRFRAYRQSIEQASVGNGQKRLVAAGVHGSLFRAGPMRSELVSPLGGRILVTKGQSFLLHSMHLTSRQNSTR